MSAIRKAIAELHYRIPRALLEKAFIDRQTTWGVLSRSNIDEQIMTLVVKPRVLVDCNLVGGIQVLIPLAGLSFQQPDAQTTVVHIPKSRTQGRSIMSVLHVAYLSPLQVAGINGGVSGGWGSSYDTADNSAAMSNAFGMMAALDKIPVVSTAAARLVAENTVMIRDVVSVPSNAFVRCIVSNDDELSDIQPKSYPAFCKLVEHAVKSYIYNTLVIEIDVGELRGGFNIGIFKGILEKYEEAEQNYQDYLLNNWQAVAFMNDETTYRRYLRLLIGGYR
jgi:hypothetical protein